MDLFATELLREGLKLQDRIGHAIAKGTNRARNQHHPLNSTHGPTLDSVSLDQRHPAMIGSRVRERHSPSISQFWKLRHYRVQRLLDGARDTIVLQGLLDRFEWVQAERLAHFARLTGRHA